jgi:hypothetical protein
LTPAERRALARDEFLALIRRWVIRLAKKPE